jgi:TRAP-type C4-dicarboxylate transport system substrate-binding protein
VGEVVPKADLTKAQADLAAEKQKTAAAEKKTKDVEAQLAAAQKPAEITEIKVSTYVTSGYGFNAVDWAGKYVEQASGGRLKFTLMPGSTVIPNAEHLFALQDGVFDMSFLWEGYWIEQVPAFSVLSGLNAHLLKNHSDNWAMYSQRGYEAIRVKIYDKFNCLPVGQASYPGNGFLANKPLTSLAAVKGMKICTGGTGAKALSSFGAEVLSLPDEDLYINLASGLVDGGLYANPVTWWEIGLQEVSKYWLYPPTMPCSQQCLIANKDFWDSLSEGDRYLIKYCWAWTQAQQGYEIEQKTLEVMKRAQTEYGITICYWTDDEWKQWKEAMVKFHPAYPEDPLWQEAKKILDDYVTEMGYL